MKLVTLLMSIPIIITWGIIALEFFLFFSNRGSREKLFKIRKWLGRLRWTINLIAVIVICYFELYEIAEFIAMIMLWCAINDVAFILFQKFISKK